MNRAKLIHLSAILANSLSSTRHAGPNSLNPIQMTRFSHLTQSPPVSLSKNPCTNVNSPNSYQIYSFSSEPDYSYIELVLSNDWSEEIKNELDKLNPKEASQSVLYILMKSNNDPQKALGFFKWARDRVGFEPISVYYDMLLRILAGKNHMEEQFWVIASEMKEKGFFDDKEKVIWTKFFEVMNKDGDHVVKRVADVILGSDFCDWDELKLLKFLPLCEDFWVRVLKELRSQPVKAKKFYIWLHGDLYKGLTLNGLLINELAKVLDHPESMEEFWEVVEWMRSNEIDTETRIKISKYLRESVEHFEFMMDGPDKPSQEDCGLLLKRLSRACDPDIDVIFRVVNRFEAEGSALDKASYDVIHGSLCEAGRFDDARRIVEAMRNAGHKPDNITYDQEISSLCNCGKFEEATEVLDHIKMEAEGCDPDINTWTLLIEGYCKAHQLDQALLCFRKVVEKNQNMERSMRWKCSTLMDVLSECFVSQNKVLGAYTFLIEMVDKANLEPLCISYSLMIKKLLEARKLEEALNLARMMQQHCHFPYTNPFVQYISKTGTLDDAEEFLKAFTAYQPCTSDYVQFVRAFLEEGRYSEAKDLLYKFPPEVRAEKKISDLFDKGNPSMSFWLGPICRRHLTLTMNRIW